MSVASEKVLDSARVDGALVEVLEMGKLLGSSNPAVAPMLFYMQETGMRARYVRLTLDSAKAVLEPGALHRMVGNLEMATTTSGGMLAALGRAALSGETVFTNAVTGTGKVMLEPTFGHAILFQLEGDGIVVDKGMFMAAVGDVKVSAVAQKTISGALFGGEGFFQTKVSGTGIVVLSSPVPMDEIEIHELSNGDVLKVDGNFAILRSEKVTLSVEKSSRSWAATSVSGEGLLQVFKGTGQVWIAPTQDIYERLATPEGVMSLHMPPGRRNTRTRDGR